MYMEESYLGDHIRMGHDNDVKSLFSHVESRESPSLQPPMELWQPRRPLVNFFTKVLILQEDYSYKALRSQFASKILSKFHLVKVKDRCPPVLASLLLPDPDELLPGDQLEGAGHLPPALLHQRLPRDVLALLPLIKIYEKLLCGLLMPIQRLHLERY